MLTQTFFRPSGSSSTAPMSFLDDFFGSLAPWVFPSSRSLPSEGWDGGGRSRDALVLLPEGLLSSLSTWSSGRGGGASGRAFGARELASVSSVHSWTGDPGVALLRWTPATFSVSVGSLSSSLHARRGDGSRESSGRFFSILGCLSRLISVAWRVGEAGEASECRSS